MEDLKTLYSIVIAFWNFIKAHAAIPTTEAEWDELTRAAGEEAEKYDGLEKRFMNALLMAYLEYVHLSAKEGK